MAIREVVINAGKINVKIDTRKLADNRKRMNEQIERSNIKNDAKIERGMRRAQDLQLK